MNSYITTPTGSISVIDQSTGYVTVTAPGTTNVGGYVRDAAAGDLVGAYVDRPRSTHPHRR
jgi:hypothetical protein